MLAASTCPIVRVLSNIKEQTCNTATLGPDLNIYGVVVLHFIDNSMVIIYSPESSSARRTRYWLIKVKYIFGVCYYPEHWPLAQWEQDAQMMAELGLTYVRIGEFAWSRLEPNPGELDFAWLDQAILTLNNAG